MSNNLYKHRLSEAITWLRFPLIFFIIMLHCYSVVRLEGDHEMYFNAVYPFALWVGETGVPGFFFISGYLFYLSKKSYSQKIRTRIHTLLVPYLLWNAALLLLYLAAFALGHPQDINGKSMAGYDAIDYLRLFWDRGSFDNGNFVPLLCPFWYIRNLLVMSLMSPLFYYLIRYIRELFLLLVLGWWLMTYDNAFIPQTILFFCLGAFFSIHNLNPLELAIKHGKLLMVLFAAFAVADIGAHTAYGTPVNLQIHRLALLLNIPALLLLADYCARNGWTETSLPDASFIVFAVHYPIVVVLRKVCVAKCATAPDAIHVLLYCLCVVVETALSMLFYQFLQKYFPKTKQILSGNR